MAQEAPQRSTSDGGRWLDRGRFQELVSALLARDYEVRGPVARDGVIGFEPIERVEQLAIGLRERQGPGEYRLEESGDDRIFGVVNGAGSLKPLVFAPREPLLQIQTHGEGGAFDARATLPEPGPVAVLGVRPCDLAALRVQDRVFLEDRFPDPWYATRRRGLFLIAVHCTRSAPTCFCTSMGTGPEADGGFDIGLVEFDEGFLATAGSPAGAVMLADLRLPEADEQTRGAARTALAACAAGIDRQLDVKDLPESLYRVLDHPRWDDVAERCLGCANCTMVCPTCFCHDERDEPHLDGGGAVRVREWDSCFDRAHGQIHGTNFRPRIRDRYRQWLVHKLAAWIDQFGTSGCVGCGRCITWCPVGIDLTEEMAALRADPE